MRIANLNGRAIAVRGTHEGLFGVDIAESSSGQFPPAAIDLTARIPEVVAWEASLKDSAFTIPITLPDLMTPIPNPAQIFAIGMNYADHATEVNIDLPEVPAVFTKFASSLSGPTGRVRMPSDQVDWEVELVAVIGAGGRNISRYGALEHIAGYMIGQDLSDRKLQFAGGTASQFSLGKSYEGFTPVGPWMTTADDISNPGNLTMTCSRQDQVLQSGTTKNLVFDLPYLVEHLSTVVELRPGDLIFTGTPDGVGFGRDPKEFLVAGDELVSTIEGLGELRQTFVASNPRADETNEMELEHA
jgi:2,4-diketo-3-deoxy-L-fuconate hydrolase